MDFLFQVPAYLASIRVNGVVDMLALGAAAAVTLFGLFVVWKVIKAGRAMLRRGRRGRLALLVTVAAASIALALSWYGMNLYFADVLGIDNELMRFALCGFIELMLIASALRSRDWRLLKASKLKELDEQLAQLPADDEDARSPLLEQKAALEAMKKDIDGRAMWGFALLAGVMSALKVHSFEEVLPWLTAPLIATWGWERVMTAEALELTVRQTTRLWIEDLKALWHRFLVKIRVRKATDLNANEQAQQQQINRMVDSTFQLNGLESLLKSATQQADTADGDAKKQADKRVTALTKDRLKVVKKQHRAAMSLMEMGLWTPAVEHEINVRLNALYNLASLADAENVAELIQTSSNTQVRAIEDGDGFDPNWRFDTGEFAAILDAEADADNHEGVRADSGRGQRTVSAPAQRTADSGHADTVGGQSARTPDADTSADADSKRGQSVHGGRGQRSAKDAFDDDQLDAAYKELCSEMAPEKISCRKLADRAGVGKTSANNYLKEKRK